MTFNNPEKSGEKSITAQLSTIRLALSLLMILIASPVLFAQTPNFDKLKARFDSGEVFQADYSHEFTDSYTNETEVSEGRIWIEKDGYKLQSEGQVLVVDGDISRVYERGRNRLIVSEYDPETDDFAPSRMLNGVDSTYSISEQRLGNGARITLETDDDFAVFQKVEILIDRDQHPMEITAYDISDNVIVTSFRNGRFMDMNEAVFTLDVPESAEVVDMRY